MVDKGAVLMVFASLLQFIKDILSSDPIIEILTIIAGAAMIYTTWQMIKKTLTKQLKK